MNLSHFVVFGVLVSLMLTACGGAGPTVPLTSPENPTAPVATAGQQTQSVSTYDSQPRKIILGMGFIPNIQFAPFYVADSKGYFSENGLEIEFNYKMEDDLLKLVGTDKLQFAIGSGDQVILARSQGLPTVYVANFYRQFPVSIASLREKNIKSPQDLEGKRVGIPALYGASYIGWKALVYATGVDAEKVDLQTIGFTQLAAIEQGLVDAAVVYIVNEPVRLRLAGKEVNEIRVSEYINLVSNGIITNEKTIEEEPELVRKMVQSFLRGLRDTLADPQSALDISLKYVPEAGGENRPGTEAVLQASIELWKGEPLGVSKREDWQVSQDFMKEMGLIDHSTEVDKLFSNAFINYPSN